MTVYLMLTCMSDALFGDVGACAVQVLEAAGCNVQFNDAQCCCGQPPFNAGDWGSATRIASHTRDVFREATEAIPIVTPSSSCAAMLRHGYEMMGGPSLPCYELSEFLVQRLQVRSWPPSGCGQVMMRVAYHRACHGRMLGLASEAEQLLASIPGVQMVEFQGAEQCCGFGGAFCIGHPVVSAGIGSVKLDTILETNASVIVSTDMGCLTHLQGIIDRRGLALQTRHIAQVLAEAIS